MRHTKHRFELGVKKEHRESLIATLTKAKALRPFAEKIITLAKKASAAESVEQKLHFRRLALSRVRNEDAVRKLFAEDVAQFLNRKGGYTRIYKLVPRVGDGAPMGLIEYVEEAKEARNKRSKAADKSSKAPEKEPTESVIESKKETVPANA